MNNSDDYSNAWDQAADIAEEQTDRELAGRIAELTRMDSAQIKSLFPYKGDAEKLQELMEAVNTARDDNEAANRIAGNMEKFGGVLIRLLKFVV